MPELSFQKDVVNFSAAAEYSPWLWINISKGSGNDGIAKQPNHYGALGWFSMFSIPCLFLLGAGERTSHKT
jgi:hypothetical protein